MSETLGDLERQCRQCSGRKRHAALDAMVESGQVALIHEGTPMLEHPVGEDICIRYTWSGPTTQACVLASLRKQLNIVVNFMGYGLHFLPESREWEKVGTTFKDKLCGVEVLKM